MKRLVKKAEHDVDNRDFAFVYIGGKYYENATHALCLRQYLKENEKEVVVRAEVPGLSESDIDLEISSDGYMTLSGEKKEQKEEHHKGKYFSEFSYGSFSRTIPLPYDLKYDDAKADFENGVLTVVVPKSEPAVSNKKKIAINKK